MKAKKKNLSTILLIIIFLIGLGLVVYPVFSDYWNSFHQSRAIASYADAIQSVDRSLSAQMYADAVNYNNRLALRSFNLNLAESEIEEYSRQLDVTGTGIMSYIEIPSIGCSLPIYHGTDEGVLQIAVGHLEGTSLPVGGSNTHCVLSGHRGLPSAKLFSDIDQLSVGDEFYIHTLEDTLTYSVDQILIVLPSEVESLKIESGLDLVTLVTCTPYGINSHRLLVRGHRIETKNSKTIRVTGDAVQVDVIIVAAFLAVPILLLMLFIIIRKKW